MMLKKFTIYFVLAVFSIMSANARIITVDGRVTMKGKGDPMVGVLIYNQEFDKNAGPDVAFDPETFDPLSPIGLTDEDGNYSVKVESNGVLVFYTFADGGYGLNYEVVRVEDLDDPIKNLELDNKGNLLDEVVVTDNANPIAVEKGKLKIQGNNLVIETAVQIRRTVPKPVWNDDREYRKQQKQKFYGQLKERKNHFKVGRREIVQPVVLNKTRNLMIYAKPIVVDCTDYGITQERMDDWDTSVDPLTPYRHIIPFKDTVITVTDTVKLEEPTDYFIQIGIRSIEDYNRVTLLDTNIIIKGSINPLQFLAFNIPPMALDDEERQDLAPTATRESRDTEGEMNLTFPVGKASLDPSLEENVAELDKIDKDLQELLADNDVTLKGIRVFGYSSPEGGYDKNLKLANDRMKTIMNMIMDKIPKERRRKVEPSSDAEVAPWEDVVKMLRTDSLFTKADSIQEIIDRHPDNMDLQFRAIARLPFYRPLLTDTYLPRLRRVNYVITAYKFRELTDDEIRLEYVRDPKSLTKYNLFRYYNSLTGDEREAVLRKCVELFPNTNSNNNFITAATDLSTIMLEKGENPFEMLSPYFGENRTNKKLDDRIPFAMKYNYAVGALKKRNYALADSVLRRYQKDPRASKAIAYYRVMQEDWREDAIDTICKDNPVNRVVIELTRGNNVKAWNTAKDLGEETAVECYVKAMAANQCKDIIPNLDDVAVDNLVKAIKLDPAMKDKAEADAMINKLLYQVNRKLEQEAEEEAAKQAEAQEGSEPGTAANEEPAESAETPVTPE